MRVICIFLLGLWLAPSFACSFVQPEELTFDKALARPGDQPPEAPKVTVHSITRGNADDPRNSCADIGVVVLAIPATAESRKLAYSFETVSGTADDIIFQLGPSAGEEEDGRLLFVFPWLDGASRKQEPLDLTVRVTPFRRSGLVGKPIDIRVVDGGR